VKKKGKISFSSFRKAVEMAINSQIGEIVHANSHQLYAKYIGVKKMQKRGFLSSCWGGEMAIKEILRVLNAWF